MITNMAFHGSVHTNIRSLALFDVILKNIQQTYDEETFKEFLHDRFPRITCTFMTRRHLKSPYTTAFPYHRYISILKVQFRSEKIQFIASFDYLNIIDIIKTSGSYDINPNWT